MSAQNDSPDGRVYCTLVMTDSYLIGATVLAHSLRDAGTRHKLAVLITPETLSAQTISSLNELYDFVIPVTRTSNPTPHNLTILARPDLLYTFTKIELFRLTQFSKIVYLDADVVALRAPDELFDVPASFAAAPDIGWPDAFNSGVMVLEPDEGRYQALRDMADRGQSFDGADQGLLNEYFEKEGWHRLSFAYNCTPNAEYQWEPAYRHYKHQISLVHFIGKQKPWNRDNLSGSGVYRELLGHWWTVRGRHTDNDHSRKDENGRLLHGPTGVGFASMHGHHGVGSNDTTSTTFSPPNVNWNPSISAPPTNSKPEAANLPSNLYYEFAGPSSSADHQGSPFRAPDNYPPPPSNLWCPVPETAQEPAGAQLKPIFPWESKDHRPAATRVWAHERSSPAPAPAPRPEMRGDKGDRKDQYDSDGAPSMSLTQPHQTEQRWSGAWPGTDPAPTQTVFHNFESPPRSAPSKAQPSQSPKQSDSRGRPRFRPGPTVIAGPNDNDDDDDHDEDHYTQPSPARRQVRRQYRQKTPGPRAAQPAAASMPLATNAWDTDPAIRRYMHTLMSRHDSHYVAIHRPPPRSVPDDWAQPTTNVTGATTPGGRRFLPSYPSFRHVSRMSNSSISRASSTSTNDRTEPPAQSGLVSESPPDVTTLASPPGERSDDSIIGPEDLDVDLANLPLRKLARRRIRRESMTLESGTDDASTVVDHTDKVRDDTSVAGVSKVLACPSCGFCGQKAAFRS